MKRLLTTCFGLGWLPLAPGSWGSLPSTFIFILLCIFNLSLVVRSITLVILAFAGAYICVKLAPVSIAATGKEDPGEVVADEVAGQAITFLAIGRVLASDILATAMLGFLLFRFFDSVKPWPIHKVEKFPKGWGILADDLLAGVYACVALHICYRLGLIENLSGLMGRFGL